MVDAAYIDSLHSTLPRVLVVDDEPDICGLFAYKLNRNGYKADTASKLSDALQLAANRKYQAILLDLFLENENALEHMAEFFTRSPATKIVILTANGSIDYAVNAMNKGASGFLVKTDIPDANVEKFKNIINSGKSLQGRKVGLSDFGIIGRSKAISNLADILEKIKGVDSTVLLQGESGTGKEVFARAIHKMSGRANGQFIAINCAAISEGILESELFGYKRGAFTDARQDRKGYFQTCSEGTLFLDEIGEMSPNLQSKLLRVLQEKEVTPLGSCKPIAVNTRIIAATNRKLKKEVAEKKFREDLFYRLTIFQIDLPPLKNRKDDIPLLVNHFIKQFNQRFSKNVNFPSEGVYNRIKSYDWPGNVRELQNAVERAVVLSTDGEVLPEDLLPNNIDKIAGEEAEELPRLSDLPLDYQSAKDNFERFYIHNLLLVTEGNITEAARVSGQYRPNLYRLIHKFQVDAQKYKNRGHR